MPDFTMCKTTSCPLSFKCHRKTAVPYNYQSFAEFHWEGIQGKNKVTIECDGFIEDKNLTWTGKEISTTNPNNKE
jgi:hypothetical protein